MRTRRMGWLSIVAIAAVGVLLGGAGPATFPLPLPAPDAEAVYLKRLEAQMKGGGEVAQYDVLEAVPGAAQPRPLPQAMPAERSVGAEALATARAYAEANNSKALIVWRDGKVQQADYFGGTTPSTPIVSKSLAKPLTAIVVGRAIALGKIKSLDQPVSDFIREWQGRPQGAMRVRHLLDMRSGLLAQGFSRDPQNIWSRAYLHPNHERIIVEDYPLTDPPGSRYEYSNATSELVALLIERATGRRYAEFVSGEVLKPLGAAGGEVWVNRPGGLAHSGCCIMLPAETYLRLAVLLLQDGVWDGKRLLPAGYVGEMRTPTPQNPYAGMGVYVAGTYTERRGFQNPVRPEGKVLHSEPYLASDLFLFDGNANQAVWIVPSEQLVVLRVGERPRREPEWDNTVLPNTIMRGIVRRPGERAPPPQVKLDD